MKPNSDGKYIFKSINFDSVFLPSPADVCQLLGFPDNVVKMLPELENYYEQTLNVSRSSRAEMTRNGVAKPTIEKVSNWLGLLPIPIKRLINTPNMLKTRRALAVGSNAGLWYSVSSGFRLAGHDSELMTLFDFIDVRAEADYQMVKDIKHQIRDRVIDKDDSNAVWQAQLATWQKHSLVPDELLSSFSLYSNSVDKLVFKTEQDATAFFKAVLSLVFDFYFSAIAHYELGLSLYYMRCGAKDANEPHRSLFSPVINTYANEKCTCFSAMLNQLRVILENNELPSSWRALAAYIDIEESGECAETRNDKQYRQLKDWRNGNNMPSATKLRQFVANYMSALGGNDVDSIVNYLRIASGIDRLVLKGDKHIEDGNTLSVPTYVFTEVLEQYPRYFEHFKQNYTTKDVQTV